MIKNGKYFSLTLSLVFKIFLNIFLVFYIAKKVDVQEFGAFSIAFIFSAMAILFLDYGFNLKSLVLTSEPREVINKSLWEMVYSKGILTGILALGMGIFFLFSPYEFLTNQLILILVLSGIPNSFGNYFVNAFKVDNNYAVESRAYAIQFLTLLIGILALEFLGIGDIVNYAYAILLARFVYFLFGSWQFIRQYPRNAVSSFGSSLKTIRITASFAIHMILSALIIHIDTFILSVLSDMEQVGIYQAGMRIIMASMLIAVILSDAFIPEISKLTARRNEASDRLSKLFGFIAFFATLSLITLFFYKSTLITLLFSEEYLVLESSIGVILAIIALRYFGIVPGIILTSFGLQRIRAIAVVVSIITSICLNLWLIPQMGISGAFMASLAAHIVLNGFYLFYSVTTLPFAKYFPFLFVILAGLGSILLQMYVFEDSLVFLGITAFLNIGLLLFYGFKKRLKVAAKF